MIFLFMLTSNIITISASTVVEFLKNIAEEKIEFNEIFEKLYDDDFKIDKLIY
jgi:hypothetical protein